MSWTLGVFVVGLINFLVGVIVPFNKLSSLSKIFTPLISPIFIASAFYWIPAMLDGGLEYKNWASIFIIPWAISGYTGILIGILLRTFFSK